MDTSSPAEQRLTELEIRSGFAEDLLDTLNQTVYRQQQQIERLQRELTELRQQLSEGSGAAPRSLRDELPPHY